MCGPVVSCTEYSGDPSRMLAGAAFGHFTKVRVFSDALRLRCIGFLTSPGVVGMVKLPSVDVEIGAGVCIRKQDSLAFFTSDIDFQTSMVSRCLTFVALNL